MALKAVAAVGATALFAYCAYFDYQRRSAPDYRQKVIESKSA